MPASGGLTPAAHPWPCPPPGSPDLGPVTLSLWPVPLPLLTAPTSCRSPLEPPLLLSTWPVLGTLHSVTASHGDHFSFLGASPRSRLGGRGEGTSCSDSAGPSVCPPLRSPPPPGLRALGSSRAAHLPAARLPRLVIPRLSPGLRGANPLGCTPLPPPTLGSRPSSGSAGWEPGPPAAEVHGRALLGPLSLTLCPPSSEIEAIKLAEQKRKAERRRRATVVVGDLQPLRDALPELLELEAGSRRTPTRR